MNASLSERRKSSRTQNNKKEDRGPGSSVERSQPSNLTLTKQILSSQKSANKSLDTAQAVRIDPSVLLPAELNEIMEGADQDLLTFINVNSAAILQHIADSVSVTHQSLLETVATESAPELDVREEKRKKPPKTKEEKDKEEEKVEELVDKLNTIEVVHPVTTVAVDISEEVTTPRSQQPERKRPLDLDNQPTAQPSTSGETRPTYRIVISTPPHLPIIMPVVRRSETAEAKKAADPKEDESSDEIGEEIQMDDEDMDDDLSKQAAANSLVEKIRASAVQKIVESRSQGAQVSNNQLAAQESEILKYVEKTSDTSVLTLLREASSQETLARRKKSAVVPPAPQNRKGPPPPWTPRNARRLPLDDSPEILPKGTLSRPAARNNQTLKRAQPYQGHDVDDDVPHKIPNTERKRESNAASSSTPNQGQVRVDHNVQVKEPRRDDPRRALIPAGVNPATPCFQYLQSMNQGKPLFRGMQQGYRQRKARTDEVVDHQPDQRIQIQPPVGQVLGAFPLKKNGSGFVRASNEVRVPVTRQVVIEPPTPSNGMQTGSQANKSPQFRVVNPVSNSATKQKASNVQHSICVAIHQQANPQSPTEKDLVPYGPQKSVPYVPTSLRRIQRRVSGTMPQIRPNEHPMDDYQPSDPSDAPMDPTLTADETPETPDNRSEAEKSREEHIEMAKQVKQEALEEEAKKQAAAAKTTTPEVANNSPPAAPAPVKQSFRPACMPGLITPKSLFNGVQQGTKEQVSGQLKKGQQQMKQVTDEIVANNKKKLEDNANFQQPTKVIWKNQSIIVPEFMRCELCKGLMGLWIDLRDARKKYDIMFPYYKCNACPSMRSIAGKFDPDEVSAEASWPSVKMNSPVKITRDFDDELHKVIGPILERDQKRRENAKKLAEQGYGQLRSWRNQQHQLSESVHCCPGANPQVARDATDLVHSDSNTSTTSDPQIDVAQAVENPRMPDEIANIITKKIEVGNTSSYSLMQLIQKILVISGRTQSEDVDFDPAIMHDISANEFMETMTTFLMSQNGFQNNVFVKDD